MSEYYIAGIPCSAELYHHGVLGQKWGQRNYQNPDGSLTPLGRIHYGYGKAKEGVGKAAKATGKGLAKAAKVAGKGIKIAAVKGTLPIRKKHTWMLSEKEMRDMMRRYDLETQYKRSKLAARGEGFTKKFLEAAGQISYKGLETLAKKTAEKAADKIAERAFESSTERAARRAEAASRLFEANANRDRNIIAARTQRQAVEDDERQRRDALSQERQQRSEERRQQSEQRAEERRQQREQRAEERRQQSEQREQRAEERRQQRAEERQRDSEYSRLFDEADRRSREDTRTPEQVAEDWGRRNAERSARDTRLADESRLRRAADASARLSGYESAYDRALAEMAREADQRRETRELNEIAEEALRNRRRR